MNHRIFLVLFAFHFFAPGVRAQTDPPGTVLGQVIDSASRQPMAAASVSVTSPTDTVAKAFSLSDKTGHFRLINVPAGELVLRISFQGYARIRMPFTMDAGRTAVDLGAVGLTPATDILQEVIIERLPILVKEDTVEYNANAFKVKPNAYAEDILKKLPGVQVDKDGNVTAQGESVQKVYVDGKEFFGTDPKLATKNITADMIESVQVFDDMSDQAKFTKIDDGSRQKALNIKLKKDKRKGYFGRASAGYGTDNRYNGNLTFNRFNEDQRFSVIGGSNNVNQQNFSFNDIVTSMGGFGARGAGAGGGGGGGGGYRGGNAGNTNNIATGSNQQGITQNTSAGLNYTDKFGGKLLVSGSYFFSRSNQHLEQNSDQQNLFADSTSIQNSQQVSNSVNQNHRFFGRLEYTIDSMTSLLYIPSVTVQHSTSNSIDSSAIQSVKGSQNYRAIDGFTDNNSLRDGVSVNNNLLFRKKFHTPGRTITIGFNNSINNSNGNGANFAPLNFYTPGGLLDSVYLTDLKNTQKTHSNNSTLSVSYTEPVGKGQLLEFNYAYTDNRSTSDRRAYNYDSATGQYDEPNLPQTNYYKNGYTANRFGLNYRVVKSKYNLQLGAGLLYSTLDGDSRRATTGKDTTLKYNFLNLVPTVSFNYKFSRNQNLRMSYRGHTNQPNITQLQNVPDVSDPLNIVNGNPSLKNEFENNLNVRYNSVNTSTFRFFSANLILDQTSNNIVNSYTTIGKGVQEITPVNLDGTFTGSSFVTYGIPLRGKLKGSNVNFDNKISYSRNPSLQDAIKNINTNWSVYQKAGVNFVVNDRLNFGVNGSVTWANAAYTINDTLNQTSYTQVYSADVSWIFVKNWVLYTDYNQTITTGLAKGYNQSIPLWNASLAHEIFKKRNGEIKISVNDILNQNRYLRRTASDRYITDVRSNVLQRYFMVSLLFNLNKAGMPARRTRGDADPGNFRRMRSDDGPPGGGAPPPGGGPGGGGPPGGGPGGPPGGGGPGGSMPVDSGVSGSSMPDSGTPGTD